MNTTNLRRKERKVKKIKRRIIKKTRKKVASLIVNVQKISIREDPQAKVIMRERRASITKTRKKTNITRKTLTLTRNRTNIIKINTIRKSIIRTNITTKRRMTIIRTRSTRITILEVFLESMKYLSTKAICSTRVNIKPNMEKTP